MSKVTKKSQHNFIGQIKKNCDVPPYSPMMEAGPKWKLAFQYLLSQFSSDFHEILQTLFSSHLASILKIYLKHIV